MAQSDETTGGPSEPAPTYRYVAFISYRHVEPDRTWVKWLHSSLESYRVPRRLRKERGLPVRLGRVFRDEEELSASADLSAEIDEALRQSRFLIVVCSRKTPASRWVAEEVDRFISLGRQDQILTLLVDGEPHEAFPRPLLEIRRVDEAGREGCVIEPLAADVRPSPGLGARTARGLARLRLIAAILDVHFDDLRQREQLRQRRRMTVLLLATLILCLGLIGAAQLFVRNRSLLRADALAGQFQSAVEANDWSAGRVEEMERVASDLDRASPGRGGEARTLLYARFDAFLASSIRRPVLQAGDIARIEEGIALMARRDPARAVPLRKALAERRSDWELATDLATPFGNVADVFEAGSYRVQSGKVVPTPTDRRLDHYPRATTRVPAGANLKVELQSDAGPDPRKPFGLAFVAAAGRPVDAYQFVLAGTVLEIRRGANVLTSTTVAEEPTSRPAGPRETRLTASRTGQQLSIQLNNGRPLVFEDVFAFPAADLGVVAIVGEGIPVRGLRVWRQTLSQAPSPLEAGDAVYAQGDLANALAKYRRQATTAAGDDRRAATYKAALCLLGLEEKDDAVRAFEEIMASGNDRWTILAGCQLWLFHLRQGQLDDAEAVFSLLSSRYKLEQLVKLVPQDVRSSLKDQYRASSLGAGLLSADSSAVARLQRFVTVDGLLGLDDQSRVMNRFILAKAYHRLGQLDAAIAVAKGGLDIQTDLAHVQGTQVSLREEYAWLLRSAGRKAEARRELDARLKGDSGAQGRETVLLIERARLNASEGQWDAADRDVESFFASAGPATHYHFWSGACLLRGFLREGRGDAAGALEAWRLGVVKLDGSGLATAANPQYQLEQILDGGAVEWTQAAIVGGLSGEWGDAEGQFLAQRALGRLAGGDEGSGGSVSQMLESVRIPPSAMFKPWATPRGREIARRIALRDFGLREWIVSVGALTLGDTARQSTGAEFTKDVEAVYWDAAFTMADRATAGGIGKGQLLQLMATWKGMNNVLGWSSLSPSLDPQLRGPLAYVVGRRFVVLHKPKDAAEFFRTAAEDAKPGSDLERVAHAALANLPPK